MPLRCTVYTMRMCVPADGYKYHHHHHRRRRAPPPPPTAAPTNLNCIGTDPGNALKVLREDSAGNDGGDATAGAGAAPESSSPSRPMTVVVFSDGRSFLGNTAAEVAMLPPDWNVHAIGVGRKIDVAALTQIASHAENVHVAASFAELDSEAFIGAAVQSIICADPDVTYTTVTATTTTTATTVTTATAATTAAAAITTTTASNSTNVTNITLLPPMVDLLGADEEAVEGKKKKRGLWWLLLLLLLLLLVVSKTLTVCKAIRVCVHPTPAPYSYTTTRCLHHAPPTLPTYPSPFRCTLMCFAVPCCAVLYVGWLRTTKGSQRCCGI